MKSVKAAPGARRLIDSLRHLGYDCSTAIADLVDNSLVAGASTVHVDIRAQHGSRPAAIIIADNGYGMDREGLQEAMRFGSNQEYSAEDLGKYGLGLKTASLSQCRVLTVASKARPVTGSRPRRTYARWDLDYLDKADDWDLLLPSQDDLEEWELEALHHEASEEHGTVVLWTGLHEILPELSSHDVRFRERHLAKLLRDTGDHLRMVFHRFMQGFVSGRRRLHLFLNGEELKAWDPFCQTESTRELEILKIPIKTQERGRDFSGSVRFSPFVLPREDEFSNAAAHKEASGPRNWNQQQGFYFYRNDRLLQAGGWSRIRSLDEHNKLLRVGVFFTSDFDGLFSINVTKMRAKIPQEIRDQVRGAVTKWSKVARERYDGKPAGKDKPLVRSTAGSPVPAVRKSEAPSTVTIGPLSFSLSNAPSHSLTVTSGAAGQVRVVVPQSHELSEIFELSTTNGDDLKRVCLAMLSIIEAVYERRMKPDAIPIEALRRAFKKLKRCGPSTSI